MGRIKQREQICLYSISGIIRIYQAQAAVQ